MASSALFRAKWRRACDMVFQSESSESYSPSTLSDLSESMSSSSTESVAPLSTSDPFRDEVVLVVSPCFLLSESFPFLLDSSCSTTLGSSFGSLEDERELILYGVDQATETGARFQARSAELIRA